MVKFGKVGRKSEEKQRLRRSTCVFVSRGSAKVSEQGVYIVSSSRLYLKAIIINNRCPLAHFSKLSFLSLSSLGAYSACLCVRSRFRFRDFAQLPTYGLLLLPCVRECGFCARGARRAGKGKHKLLRGEATRTQM